MNRDEITKDAHREAMDLVANGVPFEQAVEWASDLAIKRAKRRGQLGDVIADAETLAKEGQRIISPWLWVTSLLGFGLAILNAQRIAKMYGSWRAGKRAIKAGIPPEE